MPGYGMKKKPMKHGGKVHGKPAKKKMMYGGKTKYMQGGKVTKPN